MRNISHLETWYQVLIIWKGYQDMFIMPWANVQGLYKSSGLEIHELSRISLEFMLCLLEAWFFVLGTT